MATAAYGVGMATLRESARHDACSSLCHPDEPCAVSGNGKCAALVSVDDLRYAVFGAMVWSMIERMGGDFCADEWSEEVLPLAQRAGLCTRVIYDPSKHGDFIDAEPGTEIWYWGKEA